MAAFGYVRQQFFEPVNNSVDLHLLAQQSSRRVIHHLFNYINDATFTRYRHRVSPELQPRTVLSLLVDLDAARQLGSYGPKFPSRAKLQTHL